MGLDWPNDMSVDERARVERDVLLFLHTVGWSPWQNLQKAGIWVSASDDVIRAFKHNRLFETRTKKYGFAEGASRQGLPSKHFKVEEYSLSEDGKLVAAWLHGLDAWRYPMDDEAQILMSCRPSGEEADLGLYGPGPSTTAMDQRGSYDRLLRLGVLTGSWNGPKLTLLGVREMVRLGFLAEAPPWLDEKAD